MIKFLTACVREPDDPEKVVQDILEQLDLTNRLLKNSAGLLFCHTAFADLGVTEALAGRLPFELAGCSSQYFAVSGMEDEVMLSLTVLTSDDTKFAMGVSESLAEDIEGRIDGLYRNTAAALGGEPDLIFAFQPTRLGLNGEAIFAALDRRSNGVPIFGTCAVDVDVDFRNPRVFFGGKVCIDQMVLLMFSGPVKPRFFSALYPEKALFAQNAVITGAKDNMILSINNMPAVPYLEKLGVIRRDIYEPLFVIPLLIDYGGGAEPEIVVISAIGEDSSLICSRTVQAGGALNIGSTTADYVLKTADALLKAIVQEEGLPGGGGGGGKPPGSRGLFAFSCFSRIVVLGDPMAEIAVVQRRLAGFPFPYVFFYSAGELCPQYTGPGEMVNRFQQYAFIACLL